MSSGVEPVPAEAPAPPKESRGLLAVIIIIVVAVGAVGVYLAYNHLASGSKYPWLFRGAYADYEGQGTVAIFPVKMKMHLEVVDYNETHARLLMRATVSTMGINKTSTNVTWVDLWKEDYLVSGKQPDKVYDETINVKGIGELKCRVFEYHEDSSVTRIYVDKNTLWPVKFEFEEPGLGSLELTITKSNIPGLKG
ncbi:MAG: hypothetical protein F7C33_02055 [Desulfurococcales archaeon]|nr:hypothetical protein [Desulfurococcales archaeon]